MSPQIPAPSLIFWAIGAIYLFLKMHALDLAQGYARKRAQVLAVPEDAKVFGPGAVGGSSDLLKRADNCWRNDTQNIPMFLILAAAYLLLGASPFGMGLAMLVFCLSRSLHSVAYLRGWQPWRSLAFFVGFLATIGVCVTIVMRLITLYGSGDV